ncbi:hypothetical protein WJX77_004756 [Trebouxia sp. C0004]
MAVLAKPGLLESLGWLGSDIEPSGSAAFYAKLLQLGQTGVLSASGFWKPSSRTLRQAIQSWHDKGTRRDLIDAVEVSKLIKPDVKALDDRDEDWWLAAEAYAQCASVAQMEYNMKAGLDDIKQALCSLQKLPSSLNGADTKRSFFLKAKWCLVRARIHMDQQKYEAADKDIKSAFEHSKLACGDAMHPLVCEVHLLQARLHCARNNSRGALKSATSARKSLIRVCGSQHWWVAGASRELAKSHVATGKHSLQQAEDLCKQAYLVAVHQAPPEHMHAALTHVLAAAQASAQEGDKVVFKTLGTAREHLDQLPAHRKQTAEWRMALAHNRLLRGKLRVQPSQPAKMIKLFEEALFHQKSVFAEWQVPNPQHPVIAATLVEIAKAEEASGSWSNAVENFRQAYRMLVHCQHLSMECAAECKVAASKLRFAEEQMFQQQQAIAPKPESDSVSRQLFVLVTAVLSAVLFVVVCYAFYLYTLLANMHAV